MLTGFMATGKTTVGKLIAAELGFEFVDTDSVIEERHGPIPEIFRVRGEDEFRRLERVVATDVAARDRLVVSTGGRMMVDDRNAELIGATGDVFCLTAGVDTIVARVSAGRSPADRPVLATPNGDLRARIVRLLDDRAEAYGRFVQIDTDGRSPAQVAAEILAARSAA